MLKKVINVLTTVLLIILVIIVVALFILRASGNIPTIFGYSVFRVQTDSMAPTLNVGDVIIVKSSNAEDVQIGDIVTYDCLEGTLAGQTITHRVIKGPIKEGDGYFFVTKGDKDGAVADEPISYEQIRGEYVGKLPALDKIYTFFLSPYGLITFIAVIMLLFGYEIVSLILSYKSLEEKDDDYYEPKPKKPAKKRKKRK